MATKPPLTVALSVIPSLPRPLLARLVERAIERLDEQDGDPDIEDDDPLEKAWPERNSEWAMCQLLPFYETEDDEDDDPAELEDAGGEGFHGHDQRDIGHWGGTYRID